MDEENMNVEVVEIRETSGAGTDPVERPVISIAQAIILNAGVLIMAPERAS